MARYPLISKLILTIVALPIFFTIEPLKAENQPVAVTTENQLLTRGNDIERSANGQLSREEIDSIAAALPEGEVKQMFKKKFAATAGNESPRSEEQFRTGEGYSLIFMNGVRAVSKAKKQLVSFFTSPDLNSDDWATVLKNMNQKQGHGHLLITLCITVLLILVGFLVERLIRRFTDGLRRQILNTASMGRLRFLDRVVSHLLLNVLGFGTYMLTTFMLCALIREMDDSAMILRVKFKTIPGEQFVLRREIYRMIQEEFRVNDIEFAHRNVTVYLPPEVTQQALGSNQDKEVKKLGPAVMLLIKN